MISSVGRIIPNAPGLLGCGSERRVRDNRPTCSIFHWSHRDPAVVATFSRQLRRPAIGEFNDFPVQ